MKKLILMTVTEIYPNKYDRNYSQFLTNKQRIFLLTSLSNNRFMDIYYNLHYRVTILFFAVILVLMSEVPAVLRKGKKRVINEL